MPDSAIASRLVDLAVPVESMPAQLIAYVRSFDILDKEVEKDEEAENTRKVICAILLDQTGHDFSQYKTRTFYRRIERRMQVLQITSLAAYADRLRQDGGEVNTLFRDLLIGVTNFFRDAKAFEALQEPVRRQGPLGHDPGMGAGLCHGRGGLFARNHAAGAGRRQSLAGDLRYRHRRGGAV